MTYLEKIEKDYNDGIISLEEFQATGDIYKSSDKKEKIELQYVKEYYNDIKGIRKNVQFFFWLFIIGALFYIIASILL